MGAFVAEFIGTFALTLIGAGAILNGGAGLVGIAFAHGLVIVVFGTALGAVSGGHFNPAVSIAMLATGRIDPVKAGGYILSQVLGSVLAAVILTQVFPAETVAAAKLGTPLLSSTTSIGAGIILEFLTTFFLVLAIFGTAVDARAPKMGALFIGLTVTLGILCIGPLTGAALNPARSIGPALVGGYLDNFWLYWIAPIAGAVAAAFLYDGLFHKRED
jgi:MIP family channel proteins